MKNYTLKLYISGQSIHSETAIENLRRICDEILAGDCDVTIVDALTSPGQADADRIIATPTLIRVHPPPARRVIGDLSNTQKVLLSLGIPTN
jgi:circadian clock protein KaiB